MNGRKYIFSEKVWLYPGMAGWHFVTLPKKMAHEIKDLFGSQSRGWGSLKVQITIGKTSWKTSIFPDKPIASYVFPLKVEVRKKEQIEAGDLVQVELEIRL